MTPSEHRDIVEARFKRVETLAMLRETKEKSEMHAVNLAIKKQELENLRREGSAFVSPLIQLLDAVSVDIIDNEQTVVGSEPAYRSLWNEDELDTIRHYIMKKIKSL